MHTDKTEGEGRHALIMKPKGYRLAGYDYAVLTVTRETKNRVYGERAEDDAGFWWRCLSGSGPEKYASIDYVAARFHDIDAAKATMAELRKLEVDAASQEKQSLLSIRDRANKARLKALEAARPAPKGGEG